MSPSRPDLEMQQLSRNYKQGKFEFRFFMRLSRIIGSIPEGIFLFQLRGGKEG